MRQSDTPGTIKKLPGMETKKDSLFYGKPLLGVGPAKKKEK
jgi:hypothetical protein